MIEAAVALVQKHGNHVQKEYLASLQDNPGALKRLVREILFRPFEDVDRYERIDARDIDHVLNCYRRATTFLSVPVDDLTKVNPETWNAIWFASRRIGEDLGVRPHNLRVLAREHTGSCANCGSATMRRSALVSFFWAGMVFSREYAL